MTKKTILVTGGSGLVGSSFIGGYSENKYQLIYPSHLEMDISNESSLKRYIEKHKPDVIINFAAHRNANTAEEQRKDKKGSAWRTNVQGTKNIVSISKKSGIYLIHISTDMVFSGHVKDKGPYHELNKPKKNLSRLSWYGWTKLLAEHSVSSYNGGAIVRIGNVTKPIYDPGLDYVGKILWLFDNKKLYPLFDDQFITLSYLPDVSKTIFALIKNKVPGVFHVASSDLVTPYELAEHLLYKARRAKGKVKKISIDKYLSIYPNRYPKHGGLKTDFTQQKLGIMFPTWQKIVDNFIKYAKT